MNSSRMTGIILLAAACAGISYGQASTSAPQSLPAAPSAPQSLPAALPPAAPKPKSQKEVQAIQAVQSATDPDDKLAKIDAVLTNFADTEFKDLLLDMAVQTAEQKGDMTVAEAWAQRDLDNNPNSYIAHLAIADDLASSTKEFDLDKEEKLGKAEKNAQAAVEELKTAPKPMPAIADAQWAMAKKQYTGEAWQILGVIAVKRKNYDAAITDYKAALENNPNANTYVRLGDVYQKAGRYDEAIDALDKALADPNATQQTKNIATSLKNVAVKMKAAGIKPTTPAAGTPAPGGAPQPVPAEVKP